MPLTEKDIKQDFVDAYGESHAHWWPYLCEAKKDLELEAGRQWDPAMEAWLKIQRREAKVFNKTRRVCKMITGFERKNRLALKCDPWEGADEKTASQFSGLMMHSMTHMDGYNLLSEGFEKGPVVTGANLLQLYLNYDIDPLNGDVGMFRLPYNSFLLCKHFKNADLSDCDFITTRQYLRRNAIEALLPEGRPGTLRNVKAGSRDEKYTLLTPTTGFNHHDLMRYDEFWVQEKVDTKILIDPQRMEMSVFNGTRAQLQTILGHMPHLKLYRRMQNKVSLHILVEDNVMYSGPDPLGINEFPHVFLAGYFTPEQERAQDQIQGVVRSVRDPQDELNKRRSKMLDIIDSQISTGWEAYEDTIVDPDSLYMTGQGRVVWKKREALQYPPKQIQSADIPQGLFGLNEIFDQDIYEIPGANQELFGMPSEEKVEIAAQLAKLRQGAGITVLQDLFDNERRAKKHLGGKMIKIYQKNWSPMKVARILNQQPTPEFFNRQFGHYDCVPAEGVLTDTQRQMQYTQVYAWKKDGAPIPWQFIIDLAPIEKKEELKEMMAAAEKANAEAQKSTQQLEMLQTQLMMAKLRSDIAGTQEKLTQAQENRSGAMWDKVRAMKELQGMDIDQAAALLEILEKLGLVGGTDGTAGQGQDMTPPAVAGQNLPALMPPGGMGI